MSIIIPANSAVAGGYDVDNSVRFNNSEYLQRTNGTATDDKKYSLSFWVKRSKLGEDDRIFNNQYDGSNWGYLMFKSDNTIRIADRQAGTDRIDWITTQVFRDISAWYHFYLAIDTTQGTADNRVKFYVNGTQVTSFTKNASPSLNNALGFQQATATNLARIATADGGGNLFSGYMSEIVFIDGTQNAVTDFGEFDEDSGIFKPIDVSGLTFGTNGFYLETKQSGTSQNSSGLGADTSGNDNHFAVNNLTAIDQTTDTCTNNFATGNILSPYANRTISDGNLTITSTTTQWTNICSTIGVSSGKWWIELKHTTGSYGGLGIVSPFPQTENNVIGDFSAPVIQQIGYVAASGDKKINNSTSSYGSTWVGTGDIVNMSLNLDDNELKFYKNGTVQDSGTAIAISSGYTYFVGTSNYNSSGSSFNFGNPAFSISSGNADANGYGNFEYAPPAGFLALCTANLSEVLS